MPEGQFDPETGASILRVFGSHPPSEQRHQPFPPSPAIVVSEPGGTIQVQGNNFTRSGRVHIGFISGSDVKEAEFAADQNGEFLHLEECTNPAPGGCLVIGRDESSKEFAVARAQRSFPCLPVIIDPGTNVESADG